MAPKKLTDCPENLRESIDWLIQIKNGGDKTGLQNLAKALSTLINQAIEDADNSLKAEEKKLECPIIYEGNLSYCQVNDRSLKEAEKKLDDLKAKDDSESESQKQRLGEDIEKFKRAKENCIEYTHPRYPESQALKDVRAKLKVSRELHNKLKPFLNKLNKTTKNDRDSILHNLCSGLESFLGYDATTKSFTGEGIVYSDLDRLCDGVMTFLLKCLEENKILLKHYYPGITDTINTLESSIGKGSGVYGLKKAIEKVKTGLMWYEIELKKKTKYFADNLSDYAFQMASRNADIEYSQNIGVSKMIGKFGDYLTNARDTMTRLRNDPQGFKGLDKILQNKLTVPLEKIEEGIQVSVDALQNDDYIQAINVMQATFDILPDNVARFISEKVTNSIDDHKEIVERFKNIVKTKIDESRDKFLEERLPLVEKDLNDAVGCAEKDALNSGGFNNAKVKMAIQEIENRLKTLNDGTKPVLDDMDLGRLKSDVVGVEIGNIKKELIEQSDVKNMFGSLDTIEAPQSIFNDSHGNKLSNLVKNAKADLENALKCAEEHAKNLGGLTNETVAGVVREIENVLSKGTQNIGSMKALKALEVEPVQTQIGNFVPNINGEASPGFTGELKNLSQSIGNAEDVFIRNYRSKLTSLAKQVQNDLVTAIENAAVYIENEGKLMNKNVAQALEEIEKISQEIEKPKMDRLLLSQVPIRVGSQLGQLKDNVEDSLQSTIASVVEKLNNDFGKLKHTLATGDEPQGNAELISLITATRTYSVEALYIAEKHSVRSDGSENEAINGLAEGIKEQLDKLKDAFSTATVSGLPATMNAKFQILGKVNNAFKATGKASRTKNVLASLSIAGIDKTIKKIQENALISSVQSVKSVCDLHLGLSKGYSERFDATGASGLTATLVRLEGALKDFNSETALSTLQSAVDTIPKQLDTLKKLPKARDYGLMLLQRHIADILRTTRTAIFTYEASAFQTAINVARAEITNQVEEAKKAVENAEHEYQLALSPLRSQISSAVGHLED